jgi:hypothetical protein
MYGGAILKDQVRIVIDKKLKKSTLVDPLNRNSSKRDSFLGMEVLNIQDRDRKLSNLGRFRLRRVKKESTD